MSFLTRGKPKTTGQSGTSTGQIDPRAFSGWGEGEARPGYDWTAGEFMDIYEQGYQPWNVSGFDMMGGGPNKWEQFQQSGMEQMYDPAMKRFGTADDWVKGVGDRNVRLAGGADAPSFLTGYGPGGQISDYQKALGFDRKAVEDVYSADAERAMALARRGEGDMAHQAMGSGGGDPSVLRSGVEKGAAYGEIASRSARDLLGWDERSLAVARRAMGDDITRRDMRIAQDEGALSLKEQINLRAAAQYGDPSQRMNFLRGYGDVGARERAIAQGAQAFDYGQHLDETGWRKDMLGQYAGLLDAVPFDETTIQELEQTEKGRSILANIFGIAGAVGGGFLGNTILPGYGTVAGATAGYTAGSQLGDSLFG